MPCPQRLSILHTRRRSSRSCCCTLAPAVRAQNGDKDGKTQRQIAILLVHPYAFLGIKSVVEDGTTRILLLRTTTLISPQSLIPRHVSHRLRRVEIGRKDRRPSPNAGPACPEPVVV